jgi:hypothetical protein
MYNDGNSNIIEEDEHESKNNRKYRMLDNFGQELNDFDIVIIASTHNSNSISEIGMYYNASTFVLDDFDKPDNRENAVTLSRGLLWEISQFPKIVDRIKVELGFVGGDYRMKNVIKVVNPTDEMLEFRRKILQMILNYKIAPNVQRNILNTVIVDAKGAKLV